MICNKMPLLYISTNPTPLLCGFLFFVSFSHARPIPPTLPACLCALEHFPSLPLLPTRVRCCFVVF